MHHVAIMKKSWGLIPKILSGEKTIESRWYQTRRAPWGTIKEGDTIYFKNSGERVIARATAGRVWNIELRNLDDAREVVRRYGEKIALLQSDPASWGSVPRYCVLVELRDARSLKKPFAINKKGFGSAAAWLSCRRISDISLPA